MGNENDEWLVWLIFAQSQDTFKSFLICQHDNTIVIGEPLVPICENAVQSSPTSGSAAPVCAKMISSVTDKRPITGFHFINHSLQPMFCPPELDLIALIPVIKE